MKTKKYKSTLMCDNCGNTIWFKIVYGTPLKKHIKGLPNTICPDCGCNYLNKEKEFQR